ncbi:MAG: hypothetical protein JWN94_3286 [Betaproteobacteria bacterium]|nr:hypothetical protein [Betaproteobacteria bacterium]
MRALASLGWLWAALFIFTGAARAAAIAGPQLDVRATSPVVTVEGTAPGQAGYVHFFIVREANSEWETQVGIEMPDQRIAWSFFQLGVVVSPFMQSGAITANRKNIEVEYLYGVRPFPDDASMRALRSELEARVLPYAEAETPYCIVRGPSDAPCLSCLSFVMRILFPNATLDHERAQKAIYTTDDLLLYFAGVHGIQNREARLKRIDELALPPNVREDVIRLAETTNLPATAKNAAPADKAPVKGRRHAKPATRSQQPPKS